MRLAFLPGRAVRPLTWLAILGLMIVLVLAIQIRRFDDRVAYMPMFSGSGTPAACVTRSECERTADLPCFDDLDVAADGSLILDEYDASRSCPQTFEAIECRLGFDGLGGRCEDALREIHGFRGDRYAPIVAASIFPTSLRIEGVVIAFAAIDQVVAAGRRRRRTNPDREPN